MKKMCVFASLFAAFCIILMLPGCGTRGYGPVLKANWGLQLPAEAECREIYEADSSVGFQGDGLRCHIYDCTETDALAVALEVWSNRAGQGADGSQLAEKAEEYLTELSVPTEKRPEYENCLFWFKAGEDDSRDQILLLLDGESNRLYVIESFM